MSTRDSLAPKASKVRDTVEAWPDAGAAKVPPRLVVTEIEAAQMLGLSPRTLQRRRLDGSGPPYVQLTGGRIGYMIADLHAWLAERRFASTSDATARRAGAK